MDIEVEFRLAAVFFGHLSSCIFKKYLFICFWLHWILAATRGTFAVVCGHTGFVASWHVGS